MELTEDDIYALVQEIWQSYLAMDVLPGFPVERGDGSLSALIHIHGTWEGTVVVHASHSLASGIAAAMFDMPPGELTEAEVNDALGEIVNMLGGSVKSLVDGPASLSLPTVIGGAHTLAIPGSTPLNEVWFSAQDEPLVVRVMQRSSAAVPAMGGAL